MKPAILAAAILFSLAGPVPVLAEAPAVTTGSMPEAEVPGDTGATASPVVAEPHADAPVTTAKPAESPLVLQTPAETLAPVDEIVEVQVITETPAHETVADTSTSGPDSSMQPCPMHGMGMMRKGMGHADKGPGDRTPGCNRDGKGHQNKQEQVLRRLDMIEARMAKIEAMLESLLQR